MIGIDYECLPLHMRDGAKLYIERGVEPGCFLLAVLENDLLGAITRADQYNSAKLSDYGNFLLTIPMAAKGSHEAVNKWITAGGFAGITEQSNQGDKNARS